MAEHEYDEWGESPGRFPPHETVEIDPHDIGPVHTVYAPRHDGLPDPGEIVWTWVPYEEHDGRGKDRPVLLVARGRHTGMLLGIKLTSKWHADAENWVSIGTGGWDRDARESWAVIDRVVRVHPEGIRREGHELDRGDYDNVIAHLHKRYGWTGEGF
ncbi:MAG: type II toxin-antitoxin system PemK/MazF family toxin [Catenulisporales bacterium]|nr:type II toxin-antitoxin system PemK/MazF family toxin [Catenulisporales bacterium]